MNKKTYILLLVLFSAFISFSACIDDDNDTSIDEEWKQLHEKEFNDLAENSSINGYERINGIAYPNDKPITICVLSKKSTFWQSEEASAGEANEVTIALPRNSSITPIFTDSVKCRYDGWFYDKEGEKVIFDSTERPSLSSSADPNKTERAFIVSGVIDGWRVALYDMKVGDERELVIPYQLGYGIYASGSIPAYTTLHFDLKLTKVIKN